MYSCCSAILGAALLLSPVGGLFADTNAARLDETGFQDWTGTLAQSTLPDKSVLSEYIARTFSGNTPSASLQVSFSPRFECTPTISLVLQSADELEAEEQQLILIADDTEISFPALVDELDDIRFYTYNADHAAQQQLRQVLNVASRAIIQGGSSPGTEAATSASPAVTGDRPLVTGVTFSLLGSHMSVDAVEAHCQTHQPIPLAE